MTHACWVNCPISEITRVETVLIKILWKVITKLLWDSDVQRSLGSAHFFFTSCSTALQDSGKWLDHQGAGLLLKVSDVYVKPFCRYHNSFIHSFIHSGILYLSPGDKRRIKSHSAYTHIASDLLLFMALDSQKSCIRMSKDFESWLPVFSQEYVRHACSFVSTVTVKSADIKIALSKC